MKIAVCIKQIMDPEISPRDFKIDADAKNAVLGKNPLVISTFDENALEVALQYVEKNSGEITVFTYGVAKSEDALRKALAMKADNAVLLESTKEAGWDSYQTGKVLAEGLKKHGPFDLVFFGRQAGDSDAGIVGAVVAEELGLPLVSFVTTINQKDDKVFFDRVTDEGRERVEASPPLAVTVTNDEGNTPRIPKVKDIMMANRKQISKESVGELPASDFMEIISLDIPSSDVVCEFLDGNEPADKVNRLVEKLKESKVL